MSPSPDHAFAGLSVAGRYELSQRLGHGSFGHTFLAHDRELDRRVAIKLLDPRVASDWKAFERFEREATVLRSLRHHGVPEVFDLVREEWQGTQAAFLVMEYIDGASIEHLIDEGRLLDGAQVVSMFLDVLAILEYLHSRVPPILHRDIKPANIIVRPDGTPVLVDFGSVRHVHMGPDEAGSTVAGTYGYMPYEQYMGQAGAASDLYALAATFLHLVTRRTPREFMTPAGRIEVPADLPGDPRMRTILSRMLLPSPQERFQSAREVRHMLLTNAVTGTDVMVQRPHVLARPAPTVPESLHSTGPRRIEGEVRTLLDRATPSMIQLMDGSSKTTDVGWFDWMVVGFFSVITAGVLPLLFFSMSRSRRRRLRRFFRDGVATTAEIVDIAIEKVGFESTAARVSYQFVADGVLHRDTDQILPVIAGRWQPGDQILILYLPDRDYDSVIISAT